MKLSFQNIGKVAKADIEIDAITVITGANDTGKSTVGKLLYGIYTALNQLTPEYLFQCKLHSITEEIELLHRWITSDELGMDIESNLSSIHFNFRIQIGNIRSNMMDELNKAEEEVKTLVLDLVEIIKTKADQIENSDDSRATHIQEKVAPICENLLLKMKMPSEDTSVQLSLVEEIMLTVFSGSITTEREEALTGIVNITEDNNESISLKFLNNEINLTESEIAVSRVFQIPLYIDNPFILNDLNIPVSSHIKKMSYKPNIALLNQLKTSKDVNHFDKVLQNNNLEELISEVIPGDVRETYGRYEYYSDELKSPILVESLSAGMKSYGILKMLLKTGHLTKNEILILDEPEVHLHPEWQLKYAEFIVLLAIEYKLRILITSHSSYFIEAIELHSQKHEIDSGVRYYKTQPFENEMSEIVNVTDDLESLYIDLIGGSIETFEKMEEELNER